MARRMVLGWRNGAWGLWVSKPGYDAMSAAESQLLFSMTKRHGMMIASGTVVCPSGGNSRTVDFGYTQPTVPLVFCGNLTLQPSPYPMSTTVTRTGFTVRPLAIWDGSYPAAGRTMRWFAVAKNQDA